MLGELAAGEALRQQFGQAAFTFDSEALSPPDVAERLNKASDDALIRCAYAFGIKHDAEKQGTAQQQPEKPTLHTSPEEPPGNGNGSRKLTNRQLAAIFGLGKANGMTQQEVIGMTTGRYGREPIALTVAEASELITELKSAS